MRLALIGCMASAALLAAALGSFSHTASAEGVMVHLFQWKFNDIANECETVLGPKGYTANAGTKTVTYLSSVNGLGEIVVKGDAVLVLSGPANLGRR